jgi:hypothetical protein
MEPSFSQKKKRQTLGKKIAIFLLFFILMSSALFAPLKPAKAQMAVTDIPKLVWDKVTEVAKKLWQKGGSLAFQQTLRTALNKIAYDSANWVGSGGEGQKPLFVTQDWGAYMAQVGDEAAGSFLENFSNNLTNSNSPEQCEREADTCFNNCNGDYDCDSKCETKAAACNVKASTAGTGLTFNFCQPASLEAKVKIGLGLSQSNQPQAPACTATKMIQNWGDAAQKYTDFKDPQFLNKIADVFDPTSSELGIYWSASTDMSTKQIEGETVAKTKLLGKGGWLDPLTIDDKPISLPNQAELQISGAYDQYSSNFGKYTGDAFVDAANLFLSQLSVTAFNKLIQSIGQKSASTASVSNGIEQDPNTGGGETLLKDITTKLIQPNFGAGSVYDVLSELAMCPDKNNPGPTNCVIDSKFMQGISEQKTVAEALKDGSLHGDWRFTLDSQTGSYESSYSYRNISILRTYRIVPASWELVFEKIKAFQGKGIIKKSTISDLVSCFDPYDEYTKFSSEFDAQDQGWCTGLVDPNWVLKAPVNYCKKEGFSAQIVNKNVTPAQLAVGDNPYIPAEISIVRADNYCADNQTCIKENNDGGCEAYGYCNEEKRTWSFDGDTCAPIDNTCQAFVSAVSGKKIAYLENTLDYGVCNSENAGCKRYSYAGTYDTLKGMTIWNASTDVYLNKNASECSAKDEGCSEFMRIKPTWGANLIMNSDFINDSIGASSTTNFLNDWPITASKADIVDSSVEPGGNTGKALKIAGTLNVSVNSNSEIINGSLLPNNLELVPGQAYTLSADVFVSSGSGSRLSIGSEVYSNSTTGQWQHISLVRKAGDDFSQPNFSITVYGSSSVTAYVKNIKFEMSNYDTGYSSYGSSKVYQKLLPQYLESACYTNDGSGVGYRLKDNAPAKCSNYARKCSQSEVGCDLFKSANSNFSVPAKVDSMDYCPSECVGYDVYIARETYFNSAQADNIIPKTAEACNAESVGCNEFTNLDDLTAGGENKEYYSALKQCVKPSQATCGGFYTWEGTGTGYQLRLYSLQKDINNAPVSIIDDSASCNETIFNAPVNSPVYNPNCQQFYTSTGEIFYHLNSSVITCSDSCRAYRITEKNYDRRLTKAQCSGTNKSWDNSEGACISCVNGGVWNSTHKACVYQGIPGEGKKCSASETGCREYNGNEGNNIRLAASYDFESASTAWASNCSNGIKLDTISSNKGGHSLYYNSSASSCSEIGSNVQTLATRMPLIKQIMAGDNQAAQLKVSGTVRQGKAYSIKFLASSPAGTDLKIYIYNPDTKEKAEFNSGNPIKVSGGGNWQLYSANLENLNHAISLNETLVITANNDFHLDNFILTEITDRFYLIRSSSKIPPVCYYDNLDNYQGEDYNLGCAAYSDKAGVNHNLHTFSNICDQSSIGCEQVVSTQNYVPYGAGLWGDKDGNKQCDATEPDCVKVSADSALYIVYDAKKSCNQKDLGCSMLGQAKITAGKTFWSDTFKINNPNLYGSTMCDSSGLGCEEWKNSDDGGLSYFRDPGDNICTYRIPQDQRSDQKGWYRAAVKRCDTNSSGKIDGAEKNYAACSSVDDCAGKPCIIDNGDYPCDVSYFKTIGLGGAGNQIPVPTKEAGLCDIKASGCSEYIDPVSQFNPNLSVLGTAVVALQKNKLYLLSATSTSLANVPDASLTLTNDVKPLLINNTLGTSTKIISIGGTIKTAIFNSFNNSTATLSGSAEVRELAIGYQLAGTIDKTSCNGLVNFDNGCVLFNERVIAGASGLVNLTGFFDPYASIAKTSPVKCNSSQTGSCAANKLIKVRPNRVCSGWLDCSTYSKDETGAEICYSMKQCNSLNDRGECNNFVSVTSTNIEKPENATGYSFWNKYNISNMKEVGLNSEAHYDFEELIPSLSCARIARIAGIAGGDCSFTNIAKQLIVREPKDNGPDYPVSGKSYVKVPAAYSVSPQPEGGWINLSAKQDYYINYLLNTKNSGSQAQVIIDVKDSPIDTVFTASSASGWSRQIHKFTAGDTNPQIRIYLRSGSGEGSAEGEAYFDDINIEPVLQVGVDRYAARECRLYPTNSSLSCKNQSKNVIKDGLEGYCLEHDKNNPSVCTVWYPVDRVSSSVLGSQSLGYNGPTGLSYCTGVNANVKFAKKIITNLVFNTQDKDDSYYVTGGNNVKCTTNPNGTDPMYPYSPDCVNVAGAGGIVGQTGTDSSGNPVYLNWDWCGEMASSYALTYCGDSVNYKAIHVNSKISWNNEFIYCVPNERSPFFLFGVGPLTTAAVGLPFAASLDSKPNNCEEVKFYKSAWFQAGNGGKLFVAGPNSECSDDAAGQCKPVDEATNAEPPIRIFDNNHPAVDEQGLQYLAANIGDRDKVFNFTCNNFAQVVSSSGINKAWVVRTGITADPRWAVTTPDFFNLASPSVGLQFYGRQRNGVPFGSATIPETYDILNSGPIFLQNQYYLKDKQTIFSGRPYDCSGTACMNIGYCSDNPNVMCVFMPNNYSVATNGAVTYSTGNNDGEYINRKSCSDGGFGICRPIWANSETLVASNVLSTIFLQSYGSFKYSDGSYIPDSTGNWSKTATVAEPSIPGANVKLKYNGVDTNIGSGMKVDHSGVYSLEFNTIVNPEQQPLRMIYIEWGDGNRQAITGQDHRPYTGNPHVIYHYYDKNYGTPNIKIKVWDNWDNTGSFN